jgi:hypothetical protein
MNEHVQSIPGSVECSMCFNCMCVNNTLRYLYKQYLNLRAINNENKKVTKIRHCRWVTTILLYLGDSKLGQETGHPKICQMLKTNKENKLKTMTTSPNSLVWFDLKVCDNGKLVQLLHSWTLSIILSLSKMSSCLYFKTQRPEIGTSSIYWTQMSRLYLIMEKESSLQNAVSWNINMTTF